MLATVGLDYLLSGESWSNPSHITYSIAPDGAYWDHGTNNLSAVFNAKFGAGTWERQLARAFATWQSVANISISPTTDGYYELNTLGQAQGDTRFGDIRVGGYAFVSSTTLAQTYFPPPNGSTAAGDLEINTSANFNINSAYDLYSVLLHEIGHSLGLEHVSNSANVMYGQYNNVRQGLAEGDIVGIQSIYGARSLDAYQKNGYGLGFSTAIDVSASLTTSASSSLSGVSLPSIGSSEYFTVVAPSYATGTLQITASAANVSMLSPKVSLYNASGSLITQSSNPNSWANGVTVSTTNITPGQRYYVVVSGATGDYFDAGAYVLNVSLPGASAPGQGGSPGTQPPTSIPTSPPSQPSTLSLPSPDRFESNNSTSQAIALGTVTQTSVTNLNLSTAADLDYFRFRSAKVGTYQIVATGTSIKVLDQKGRMIASGNNQLGFSAKRGLNYQVVIYSASHSVVSNYSLSIGFVKANNSLRFYQQTRRLFSARMTAPLGVTTSADMTEAAQKQSMTNGITWLSTATTPLPKSSTSAPSSVNVRPLATFFRRNLVTQVVDYGQHRQTN